MSATGPTLVRSSVGQTVDSFVWVYMILSHSPIHVRFSCVFFTDGLGLEPQRQSACQQDAGKRLVFNLLRPDSIAWNCGRETGSFSPDSLWIFGSRLFLFFFYLSFSLPLSSSSTSLSITFFPSPLSRSLFFHESLFRFRTFTFDIYLGNLSRLKLLSTLRFYIVRFYTCTKMRDQVGASFAKQALYYSRLVHLKGLISRECRFCGYIVPAGLPPPSRLFTRIFAPQEFNVSSKFFWTRLKKIRVWINWCINLWLFKRWFLLTFEKDAQDDGIILDFY